MASCLSQFRTNKNPKRMSENENENQPPAPSKQTSSVPLKKETVRVTLKAADSPPAVPSATVSMSRPTRPPIAGGPPRPSAPAPTIPLRTAGAPSMAPAPTIRLASSATPTGAVKPPGSSGVSTMALPKATVQFQPPTQPLGTTFPTSQPSTLVTEQEEEEEVEQGLTKILSGVGLAAALIIMVFQLMTAGTWINAVDNGKKGDWTQLSPL